MFNKIFGLPSVVPLVITVGTWMTGETSELNKDTQHIHPEMYSNVTDGSRENLKCKIVYDCS